MNKYDAGTLVAVVDVSSSWISQGQRMAADIIPVRFRYLFPKRKIFFINIFKYRIHSDISSRSGKIVSLFLQSVEAAGELQFLLRNPCECAKIINS